MRKTVESATHALSVADAFMLLAVGLMVGTSPLAVGTPSVSSREPSGFGNDSWMLCPAPCGVTHRGRVLNWESPASLSTMS